MRPTAVIVAALAVLTAASSTATPATAKTAQVVVIKTGIMRGAQGSNYAEYALELQNRSAKDALGVTVKTHALDRKGQAFTSDEVTTTVIPAGTTLVVSGALIWNLSID